MPAATLAQPLGISTPLTSAQHPVCLFVNENEITSAVPLESVTLQDSGSAERGSLEFDVVDMSLAVALADGAVVRVYSATDDRHLFWGVIASRKPEVNAIGRIVHVTAYDIGQVLDKALVVYDSRSAGESDQARIEYFLAYYGGLLNADRSQIASTNASMPAQVFVGQTLRAAIEQVAAMASSTTTYFVDNIGRLAYFSSLGTTAPYAIRIGSPGGGEVSPEDLQIEYDSSNIINAYYVRGATPAGSSWFTNPDSIAKYGRRESYIDAPDADTYAKASQVGLSALADTKDPITRGSFTQTTPYDGWRAGQTLTINSAPQFDISGATTFRIARVTTTFLSGLGDRRYAVEFGAPGPSMVALGVLPQRN